MAFFFPPDFFICRYGDPASVRHIVRAGGGRDMQRKIKTVRGELDLLDCALECEAPEHVIVDVWTFLRDSGADAVGARTVRVYPTPYPEMRLSRFLATVLLATRNRWQTRMDDDGRLQTTFRQVSAHHRRIHPRVPIAPLVVHVDPRGCVGTNEMFC
jgi:hypothetical protein